DQQGHQYAEGMLAGGEQQQDHAVGAVEAFALRTETAAHDVQHAEPDAGAKRHQSAGAGHHHHQGVEFLRTGDLAFLARVGQPFLCWLLALVRAVLILGHGYLTPAKSRSSCRASTVSAWKCARMSAWLSQKMIMPITRVSGKPMAKMFSCGAARAMTPNAMLITSSAVTAGSAISTAAPSTQVSLPAISR